MRSYLLTLVRRQRADEVVQGVWQSDGDVAVRRTRLVHMECQGYRDKGFPARLLWYHAGFALRNRGKRRVRTVALWLMPLPKGQPKDEVTVDDITVKVTTIVLPEVPASSLL